ncbi:N-acetylneuraminate lyase isoform X9 [Oryctolagus cuniculus]|uniref:N-acetylneuraminate lyase isoform X9 n=1 Tax=Oryctolagus cuniculus TaxID=9986 RepID=UPI0038795B59
MTPDRPLAPTPPRPRVSRASVRQLTGGGLDPSGSSMASPKKQLQGLVAATITPMTENGEVNVSVIGRYVDYLVKEQGVKRVFVNGTTGEGLSLSIAERRRLAEEWVAQGRSKLEQVVVHVGALSLKESQELAQHAAEIGADGIAAIAPFFLRPQSPVRAEELLDGIQAQIPSFQGLKFSDTDLLDFGQCVDQHGPRRLAFLFGVDELLSALVMGATGAVGSTYNYLGRRTNMLLEAFQRGELSSARSHQFCIQRFINYVVKLGFGVSQTKAIMTLVSGIPMGPPRLPLLRAPSEFTEKAAAKLRSLDLLPQAGSQEGSWEACG